MFFLGGPGGRRKNEKMEKNSKMKNEKIEKRTHDRKKEKKSHKYIPVNVRKSNLKCGNYFVLHELVHM